MASDSYLLDESFFHHSDVLSSDMEMLDPLFLSETFFSSTEPPPDILKAISDDTTQQIPTDTFPPADQTAVNNPPFPALPTQEFNNLSLYPTTQLQSLPINAANPAIELQDYSFVDTLLVNQDGYYVVFDSNNIPYLLPESKFINQKPSFLSQPYFTSLLNSPNFEAHVMGSSYYTEFTGPMRRKGCRPSNLHFQPIRRRQLGYRVSSSNPLVAESLFIAAARFMNAGRYSAEERKERIHKYRSKRTQRNYGKKVKYACRKTLADRRPRIRGRFARMEETEEIPNTGFNQLGAEEDELWAKMPNLRMINTLYPTQFQYYNNNNNNNVNGFAAS